MTEQIISPLRQRMIEDMTVRGYTAGTQRSYITMVRELTLFFGTLPDQANAEDLRRYCLRLAVQMLSRTHNYSTISI